ncbi:MAG: sulfite exporter TauE/SafE family protein [Bacteroidia bacterium]|nr:MAG: sulfite exporter TauE/SafE family protein [Bacteroidia bacterium]
MNFLVLAIILGFGGSLHCVGMCGPLVMMVPFETVQKGNKFLTIFSYFVSKAVGYAILGLLFGLVGVGLNALLWQNALSIIAGVFILLIAFKPSFTFKIFKVVPLIQSTVQQKNKSLSTIIKLGFLNAFLPCGLVYTALFSATIANNIGLSALFMFLFGIASSYLLIVMLVFKNALMTKYRNVFQKATKVLSIIVGLLLIIRGLGLDIHYLSPVLHGRQIIVCP